MYVLIFVSVAGCKTVLTDLTLWPMPIMSWCCFLIVLTNSIGIMLESYAWVNWRAAPSRAPPNLHGRHIPHNYSTSSNIKSANAWLCIVTLNEYEWRQGKLYCITKESNLFFIGNNFCKSGGLSKNKISTCLAVVRIHKQVTVKKVQSMHGTINTIKGALIYSNHNHTPHLSPTVRSPEAREDTRSLPARAATMVLWAPETAGPWSAVTIRHISRNLHA